VLADGKWRSSNPALQELFNDHLPRIQGEIPENYGREDRERCAAEAAARDFDPQIVNGLLTPIEHKDRERHHLERFRANFSEFPEGKIIESEEPDFFIERAKGKILGIELTELYRTAPRNQVPRQAIESLMRQIVQRAQSIYESAGGPPFYVYVYFAPRLELKKNDVAQIAQKLASIVADNTVTMDQQITVENRSSNRVYFPEQIISIRISRHSFMTDGLWAAPDGDAVPHMSAEEIRYQCQKQQGRSLSQEGTRRALANSPSWVSYVLVVCEIRCCLAAHLSLQVRSRVHVRHVPAGDRSRVTRVVEWLSASRLRAKSPLCKQARGSRVSLNKVESSHRMDSFNETITTEGPGGLFNHTGESVPEAEELTAEEEGTDDE
jgi:hypothetical protein